MRKWEAGQVKHLEPAGCPRLEDEDAAAEDGYGRHHDIKVARQLWLDAAQLVQAQAAGDKAHPQHKRWAEIHVHHGQRLRGADPAMRPRPASQQRACALAAQARHPARGLHKLGRPGAEAPLRCAAAPEPLTALAAGGRSRHGRLTCRLSQPTAHSPADSWPYCVPSG